MGLNRRGAEQPSEKRVLDFDGLDPRGFGNFFFVRERDGLGKYLPGKEVPVERG